MSIRFTKIKHRVCKKVFLEYQQRTKDGTWDDYSMSCSDKPTPAFIDALKALIEHAVEACELPVEDSDNHKWEITGVSFSYSGENDTMGVTISALRELFNSNSPLVLNTPHKIVEPYSLGADDTQVMTDDCRDAVELLIAEAEAYLSGDRAQTELFAIQEDVYA